MDGEIWGNPVVGLELVPQQIWAEQSAGILSQDGKAVLKPEGRLLSPGGVQQSGP